MEKIEWEEAECHYRDGCKKACQLSGIGRILDQHGDEETGIDTLGSLLCDLASDILESFNNLENILENVANGEAKILKEKTLIEGIEEVKKITDKERTEVLQKILKQEINLSDKLMSHLNYVCWRWKQDKKASTGNHKGEPAEA